MLRVQQREGRAASHLMKFILKQKLKLFSHVGDREAPGVPAVPWSRGRLFSLALSLPGDGLKALPHEPMVMRHHAEVSVAARRQEINHGLVVSVDYGVAHPVIQ